MEGGPHFDSDAVLRLASQTGARQVSESTKSRSLTFKTRTGYQVTTFLNTGTVALVVDHPRQGQVQVFQYEVDLQQLQDIFISPIENAGSGYHKNKHTTIPQGEDEEASLRRHMEALESEAGFIAAEKAEVRRRGAAANYDLTPMQSYGDSSDRKRIDGTNMSDLRNSRNKNNNYPSLRNTTTTTGNNNNTGSGGYYDNDSDSESDKKLEVLLKQQSQVSAQLEEVLLAKRKSKVMGGGGGLNSSSMTLQKSNSRTRSASLKRGQSLVATKPGVRAAPDDSCGRGDDSPKKKLPFQTQKSTVNPNSSAAGSHVNAAYRQRGNQCCYALYKPEYHKEFGAAWSAKPANVVALGRGYVVIYDDGSVTWWDVPKLLDDKLKEQGASSQAVRYLALGSDENYYVKFVDGKMEWCGPDTFGDALKEGIQKSRLLVDKVAFGPNQGWLILWSDGSVEHERVPATLEVLLKEKTAEQHVKDITVGPNEEWFVIFKDNSVRADNLPDSLYRILSEVQEGGGRVRQVIFGENSSWYVRYWDGKA